MAGCLLFLCGDNNIVPGLFRRIVGLQIKNSSRQFDSSDCRELMYIAVNYKTEKRQKKKHETGFEPATLALARRYSTTEPLAHLTVRSHEHLILYYRVFDLSTVFLLFCMNLFIFIVRYRSCGIVETDVSKQADRRRGQQKNASHSITPRQERQRRS